MKIVKEDRELNLKELLLFITAKWRSILLAALLTIVAVVILNISNAVSYAKQESVVFVCRVMIKSVIKYVFVVVFVMFVIYAIKYIFSDTIKSVNDYLMTCEIRLIGVIPKKQAKKVCCIDRFIRKCNGTKVSEENREELEKRISNVIACEIGMTRGDSKAKIAVVSSLSYEIAEQVYAIVSNDKLLEYATIELAGNVMESASAVEIVSMSDYVVLVESQGNTKYFDLVRECKELERWNKNILGTVLVNVDAV